jgi:hypothetical protein
MKRRTLLGRLGAALAAAPLLATATGQALASTPPPIPLVAVYDDDYADPPAVCYLCGQPFTAPGGLYRNEDGRLAHSGCYRQRFPEPEPKRDDDEFAAGVSGVEMIAKRQQWRELARLGLLTPEQERALALEAIYGPAWQAEIERQQAAIITEWYIDTSAGRAEIAALAAQLRGDDAAFHKAPGVYDVDPGGIYPRLDQPGYANSSLLHAAS